MKAGSRNNFKIVCVLFLSFFITVVQSERLWAAAPIFASKNLTGDIQEEQTFTVTFTVTDDDTPPANLNVWANSENQLVAPNMGITCIRQTGSSWQLSVTPTVNAVGEVVIVIYAADSGGETGTAKLTLDVTPVNDAPILNIAATHVLTDIDEDVSDSAGNTIAEIIKDGSVTEIPTDEKPAKESIAVIGVEELGKGVWQYSNGEGGTWLPITPENSLTDGTLGGVRSRGILLSSTDRIRFLPNPDYSGTAYFTFRAWDESEGISGTYKDTVPYDNTPAASFSVNTDTATIIINPVNDAPVLINSEPKLRLIQKNDFESAGDTIGNQPVTLSNGIVVPGSIQDVDNAIESIAITALDNTNGEWQYSINNIDWYPVDNGNLGEDHALLLGANAKIRFVPDLAFTGEAKFTFRAWDQSDGAKQGTYANTTENGGITPFSTEINTASITVTPANTAPVLNEADNILTPVDKDNDDPPGNFVAEIIADDAITEISPDELPAVKSIAITGVEDGLLGVWQYRTEKITEWTPIRPPVPLQISEKYALLLTSTAKIRFVPSGDYDGSATFVFRAWDRSDNGTEGTYVNTLSSGGNTSFSKLKSFASITIKDINVAPILEPGNPALPAIDKDMTDSPGVTIKSILISDSIIDKDPTDPVGAIAVTYVDDEYGVWEYSTDNGKTWKPVSKNGEELGGVNERGLLLSEDARIRFIPEPDFIGEAIFAFRAWDQSVGTEGTYTDTIPNGGATAFSLFEETATIQVLDMNNAPVLAQASPVLTTIDKDNSDSMGNSVAEIIVDGSVTEITEDEQPPVEAIAIIGTNGTASGTWQYLIDDGIWKSMKLVSNISALLLKSTDRIRFVPADNVNAIGEATFTFRAWDMADGAKEGTYANAGNNGGNTSFSTNTNTATIIISDMNNAPVLADSNPDLSMLSIDKDMTDPPGETVGRIIPDNVITDKDTSQPVQSIAITDVDDAHGTWEYSMDNGTTWQAIHDINDEQLGGEVVDRALLLRSVAQVRFVPELGFMGKAFFKFRAWDEIEGENGTYADTADNGGYTSFSEFKDTAWLTVADLNTAPVLADADPVLTTINIAMLNPPGDTVADIVVEGSVTEIPEDEPLVTSIAIIGISDNGIGTWEYSTDNGSTWKAIDKDKLMQDKHSLLLTGSARVRFQLADINSDGLGDKTGEASFTFRAWDESSGSEGSYVNTNAPNNGGYTPFSENTNIVTLIVTPVPEVRLALDPNNTSGNSPDFTASFAEDGEPIHIIADDAYLEEKDGIPPGWLDITITNVQSGDRLIADTTGTMILAKYDGNLLTLSGRGTLEDYQQVLRTVRFQNTSQHPATAERIIAYSVNDVPTAGVSRITVLSKNDAPVNHLPGDHAIEEDTFITFGSANGNPISVTDPDVADKDIIKVTIGVAHGILNILTGNIVVGNNTPTVTMTASLWKINEILAGGVKYIPATDWNGTDVLTIISDDQGYNGTGGPLKTSGTINITVHPVPDPPVLDYTLTMTLTPFVTNTTSPGGNTVSDVIASADEYPIADPDGPSNIEGIAVIGIDDKNGGVWQYSTNAGATWYNFDEDVSQTHATLLIGSAKIRFLPNAGWYGPPNPTISFLAWDTSEGIPNGTEGVDLTAPGMRSFSNLTTPATASITVRATAAAPPISNAGPNQTVYENTRVVLDGSNSVRPDGVYSYQWTQLSGGPKVTLYDAADIQAYFISPSSVGVSGAVLTFELAVADQYGQESRDKCIVNVVASAGNSPPEADAGYDMTVDGGDTVILDAGDSYDPEGNLTYNWEQISGQTVSLSATTTAYQVRFTAPSPGETGKTLIFQVTVTDTGGLKATDTCIVNVAAPYSVVPTANAGADQTVWESETVTLNASGSYDPGNGTLSYSWTQIQGKPVTLSDTNTIKPTFIAPSVGVSGAILKFQVTVQNEDELKNTDTVEVEVIDNGITGFSNDTGVISMTSSTSKVMGIKVNNGGNLVGLKVVDPSGINADVKPPSDMIYGLLDLEIKVDKPGATAEVTLYLPELYSGFKWYKYSGARGWYSYEYVLFDYENKQVTLTLIDGGIGDDDGVANGVIKDPSGPGKATDSPASSTSSAEGDGGSNCFINTSSGVQGRLASGVQSGALCLVALIIITGLIICIRRKYKA